ncbi:MAG TPA: putative Ig domain-containing protein [Terracidiphilus sp.]|nr:putative Ig domain-containing protein [Terracidiphilus sp.]
MANDKNAAGVSWSVSGGGALSSTTTTGATYTAPAATKSGLTVTVTATSVADSTKTGTATITVPAMPTVSTTSDKLTGTVGAAFSVSLQGSGGISPYKNWVVSTTGSALPACLTLSSAGVLATTSGTAPMAACAGTYTNLIFTYSDSGTPTPLTATSDPMTATIVAAPAIAFTPTLPAGAVGSAYAGSAAAAGGSGALTYSVSSGALPADLALNAATGAITGTPKAADAGTASFKIAAADAFGDTATSGPLTINVAAAPAITLTPSGAGTVALTGATYQTTYSATITAAGGAGTLTLTETGALPAGLTYAGGVISGKPTAAGTTTFSVKAADAFGDSATQSYSITVTYPAMTVNAVTLPTGYLGSAYTATTLAATGGSGVAANYTWALSGGTLLPGGLQLSAAGVISGTPSGTTTGTINFKVTVTDTVANLTSAATSVSIVVKAGVAINAIALPTGYLGSAYPPQGSAATMSATGGAGSPYTWNMTAAAGSSVPAGLIIGPSTGAITGTPTAQGTYSVVIKATDGATPANSASVTLPIAIGAGVSVTVPALSAAYPGTAYTSAAFTASGGSNAGFQWSWAAASGSSLPNGLSIGAATGIVTGTPVNAGTSNATSNVVVTATDSLGNKGTANATVTIEGTLKITTASLPAATVGANYSQGLVAAGGSGTYPTWAVASGGVSLTAVGLGLNTATGVVSGASPTAGTATFSVTVTDSQGHVSAAVNYTIDVNSQLKVNQTTLPAGDVGASYSQTLTASGGTGSNYTWLATSSNLASYGLALSTTGAITGTPTQSGTASFTAKVTDSGSNTATQALSIQVYSGLTLPAANSLPQGYTGVAYSGSVSGSGGSGNLSIAVTSALSPSDGTLGTTVNVATVNVSGTPTAATTVSFSVKLTDTTTSNSISQTYGITISTPSAPTLPAPNPASLPSATVNTGYTGSITASGGVGPNYTWTVNSTVLTNGNPVNLGASGMTVTTTGTNVLSVGGTPSATGPVQFPVTVKDNTTNLSSTSQTYTIQVNAAGSQVSGQIFLNNCGGGNVPPITVSINTSPVQHVTSDNNGNYSFASIPNGTYTITPSIAGAASLFSPATITNVVVNNNSVSGENFQAQLGYTVSGTVTYSASGTARTGQTYLMLNSNNCGGNGGGTSISETTLTSGGAFTIRGVPPGSYTLQAWMDTLGQSAQNAVDPAGSASFTVDANVSNAAVTMHDPTYATPTSNPTIQGIIPNPQGVLIEVKPSQNSNGLEDANQYLVEWSTSPTLGGGTGGGQFATITGSYTFTAGGSKGVWLLDNAMLTGTGFSFTSGQTYYFQARSFNTLDTANPHPSGWCNYTSSGCGGTTGFTGVTIGAPACTGTCTSVSSSVTIPAAITIKAGAPLYLGLVQLDSSSGGNPIGIYVSEIASPSHGANDFTVTVPSGSNYAVVGILDQNNNGGFGAGSIGNTDTLQGNLTISGSTQNVAGITLSSLNSTATVSTQFTSSSCKGCGSTSTSYGLSFQVKGSDKLPVAVTLNSGPNLLNNNGTVALDMSICTDCGNPQFDYNVSLPVKPNVGDTYGFTVTYSDGSQDTGATVVGAVTGWNGGSSVVGASDAPTALAPNDNNSTSTTPTFTWTDSANAMGANFSYNFYIYDQSNCTGNCNVWQIPGNYSKSNGFSSSITSITWGTDPTGGGSTPSVGSLTLGDVYNWTVQVQDTNGNQAQTQVWYQP